MLINGAGGSIGTFGVQLAKLYGAHVTAVDSADKLEMLRALGADRVIDYSEQDFTRLGERYEVIFDVVGKSAYSACLRILEPGGRYLLANPRLHHMIRAPLSSMRTGKKVIIATTGQTSEDLVYLKELIEAGQLVTVIDRSYPLEQMAEAHRYVETGRKKGHVVIGVAQEACP